MDRTRPSPGNGNMRGTAGLAVVRHEPKRQTLPLTIAGPAVDDRAVEAAFLTILTRRHPGTRWEVPR